MSGHNLVAIYDRRQTAEQARAALIESCFTDVRLSEAGDGSAVSAETVGGDTATDQGSGFLSWLFGETDAQDRRYYEARLHGERTAVSVIANGRADEAERILERFEPVDL